MLLKRFIICMLICFLLPAGAVHAAENQSIEIRKELLRAEYGSDLKWERVSESGDSLALFAALCLRDMVAGMDASIFRIDKIKGLYAYRMAGTPSLYVHTPVYDWTVYTIMTETVSVSRNNPVADDKLSDYAKLMVD